MDQPKIERMLRLMALLSSNVEYTVDELGEKLGLSQRTIYRYIDTFKDAGFAVEKVRDYVYHLTALKSGVADLSNIVYFSPEEAYIVNRLIDGLDSDNALKDGLKHKLAAIYDRTSIAGFVDCPSNAKKIQTLAEAIIAGTKPVEFRECKPHYGNRIFDKAVMHWRDLHDADPSITDEDFACADPIRQVRQIHFYDYNGTWSLDVSVKETGFIAITDADIKMLQDRFGCHDYDAEPARLAAMGIPESERPLLFYFAIKSIIDS